MRRTHRANTAVAARWLLFLLVGLTAPAVAHGAAFDLAAASDPDIGSEAVFPIEAGADRSGGAPAPFRLLADASSRDVLDERGWKGEFVDEIRPDYSLLPSSEESPGPQSREWRGLAGPGLAQLAQGQTEPSPGPPPAKSPDWPGIARDTALFFAYQAVSVAVLYALPSDINLWQDTEVSFDEWWHNVSRPPVWDGDAFGTNYIVHPYWGATYYIRARERGFGKWASFGYSLLLSTLYEYGAEAFFERPSGQDLMVTPILGSLLGAFVFEPVRDWVKRKPQFKWYDQAILIATDPLGTINSVVERILGIKSEILLHPTPPASAGRALTASERARTGPRAQGFSVSINVALD